MGSTSKSSRGVSRGLRGFKVRVKKRACTTRHYDAILIHELPRWDMKLMVRETSRGGHGNIYRLGHLFEAAEKVRKDLRGRLGKGRVAKARFAKALVTHFEPDFPPIKKVLKQIREGTCKIK